MASELAHEAADPRTFGERCQAIGSRAVKLMPGLTLAIGGVATAGWCVLIVWFALRLLRRLAI